MAYKFTMQDVDTKIRGICEYTAHEVAVYSVGGDGKIEIVIDGKSNRFDSPKAAYEYLKQYDTEVNAGYTKKHL